MARKRSLSSIEADITKTETEYRKAQEKCRVLEDRLKHLRRDKDMIEGERIMEAFKKSGKTYRQLMTFLGV
ncbi:MAG: hypothetical protein ACI3Z0_05445 [Candidatus Cryptobacteroides sp.]